MLFAVLIGGCVCQKQNKLEEVKVNLNKIWYLTQEVTEANLQQMPQNCKTFELGKYRNCTNLDTVIGKKGKRSEKCIVYNEFELAEDAVVTFGTGADWWFDTYLNGKKIYSTPQIGNTAVSFSPENHVYSAVGKKGKNLIAVVVTRGANGYDFCFDSMPYTVKSPDEALEISVKTSEITGRIKPMNAVNNGPGRSNVESFKALKAPYSRNHDASHYGQYGGEHTVDVHAIFRDFSKDPYDPANYDFLMTDIYVKLMQSAGMEVYYRLGSKIEHYERKLGTLPPPDPKKWAVICEHIIRHYTEGWANGYKYKMTYWEIWNEPDIGYSMKNSPTWQGTDEQFFELFSVTAKHLKKCFPHLKIGGPAVSGLRPWIKRFLKTMAEDKVPMDFFSWHIYTAAPDTAKLFAEDMRKFVDDAGYKNAETHLNEWNYINPARPNADNMLEHFSLRGAAFCASMMNACQASPLDMLMYYDTRPTSSYNGLFEFITYKPLKTYYVFIAWAKLAELGKELKVTADKRKGLYYTAATDGKGKYGILISRYFDHDRTVGALPVTLKFDNIALDGAKMLIIDGKHNLEEVEYKLNSDGSVSFDMQPNTIIYMEK